MSILFIVCSSSENRCSCGVFCDVRAKATTGLRLVIGLLLLVAAVVPVVRGEMVGERPAPGRVYAWGPRAERELALPEDLGLVCQVSVGENNVLALRSDGTVAEWGADRGALYPIENDFDGVLDIEASGNTVIVVNAGGGVLIQELGEPVYEGPRNVISASLIGSAGLVIVAPGPSAEPIISSIELIESQADELRVVIGVRDSEGHLAALEQLERFRVEYTTSLTGEVAWMAVPGEVGPALGTLQVYLPNSLEQAFVRLVRIDP